MTGGGTWKPGTESSADDPRGHRAPFADTDVAVDRRQLLRLTGGGLVATLAGCPGGQGDTPEGTTVDPGASSTPDPAKRLPVTFRTDYDSDRFRRHWEEELIPTFEAQRGVEIYLEYPAPPGGTEAQLSTRVERGTNDIEPLTFEELTTVWQIADPQPVTALVDAATARHGDLLATPYHDGQDVLHLPHGYYADTFQYRKDVYEDLSLSPPTSFRGLLQNARAIDESQLDIRGYGLATGSSYRARAEFQVYLARMGVSPIGLRWRDPDARETLEIAFPELEVTTLLEFFRELARYSSEPKYSGWSRSIFGWLRGRFAQQHTLNCWPAMVGGATPRDQRDPTYASAIQMTAIAPLPYWAAGDVARGDAWIWEPVLDGYVVLGGGPNTPGAKRWLEWLYAEQRARTAGMYPLQQNGLLPAYADIIDTEEYRDAGRFNRWPNLYEQVRYIQERIVEDHYFLTREARFDDPVARQVGRKSFYGKMVRQVVDGAWSPAEAYTWGRERLETSLEAARERLR